MNTFYDKHAPIIYRLEDVEDGQPFVYNYGEERKIGICLPESSVIRNDIEDTKVIYNITDNTLENLCNDYPILKVEASIEIESVI